MADTFPNGIEKYPVTCPGCGTDIFVQLPGPDALGTIKAECGDCAAYFTFDSPHGPDLELLANMAGVVVSDNGIGAAS